MHSNLRKYLILNLSLLWVAKVVDQMQAHSKFLVPKQQKQASLSPELYSLAILFVASPKFFPLFYQRNLLKAKKTTLLTNALDRKSIGCFVL